MSRTTGDGHERTLQVNYLAMVLLTELLEPRLADGARVVNLASATHAMAQLDLPDLELQRGYSPVRAYARSKLAIVMYTRWLAGRMPRGITAVSIQPGVIDTGLLHAMFGSIGGSVGTGADSILSALAVDARGGEYYDEGRLVAWCWAVNGFFSVIGSTATTMLSMTFGFNRTVVVGLVLYVAAVAVLATWRSTAPDRHAAPASPASISAAH